MSNEKPIIRLEKVSKGFNGQVVLDRLDLAIAPGNTTVVIGPSGCGKTVLLKHIIGLLKPDSGRIFFGARDMTSLTERELMRFRRRMGLVFQGSALFDSMSVQENICFPMVENNFGTESERRRRCREVLSLVGMDGTQEKYPEELSGGQKKRVALARAIALNPDVLLYDEPTTGLDPIRADLINELIIRLQEALGTTAVVVTHDMKSARRIADRIVMLYQGRLIADTTPERLDTIDNDVVARFVKGRASREEMEQIETGRFLNVGNRPCSEEFSETGQ